jgi:hypothetical protein
MRRVLHTLIGIASWLLILALWTLLVRDGKASAPAVGGTVTQLAALAGLVLAVTTWWIRHNVGIHRRLGPRTGRATEPPRTDIDKLGRPVCWSLPGAVVAAYGATHLVVELADDVKTYRRAG